MFSKLMLLFLFMLLIPLYAFAQDVVPAIAWYKDPTTILLMLLGLSEVIGMSPFKNNSIFQAIWSFLKFLKEKILRE